MWFSNFLKYLVFELFISLSTFVDLHGSCGYVPRFVQNGPEGLGLGALEGFDVGIGGLPP
jgi:hypothetical protein